MSDEELTATIAMLDENQDGQVSMEEFVRMGKISTNLDDTRAQLQESQSELSAAQGSHAQRLEQVVAAQEEMLATQEQLLAVNNQRQREKSTTGSEDDENLKNGSRLFVCFYCVCHLLL